MLNQFDAPLLFVLFIAGPSNSQDAIELLSPNLGFRAGHAIPMGSVFGHKAVPGVIAVGAIDAGDAGHDDIEAFSSQGPSEVYFPSFESRLKPDITGIDGVAVTGAGGFPNPFFGTSAAAPHIAAIAALVLEATRRTIGWTVPILAMLFLGHAYLCYLSAEKILPSLPAWTLPNAGQDLQYVVSATWSQSLGVFGPAASVMFKYVFLFVVFHHTAGGISTPT